MRKIKKKTAIITIVGSATAAIIGGLGWYNYEMNELEMCQVRSMYATPIVTQTFNSRFTGYEGSDVTAKKIKSLMSDIKMTNATNEGDKFVKITGITTVEQLKSNATYTVECKYNDEGYVCEVIITENSSDIDNNSNSGLVAPQPIEIINTEE